MKNYAKKAQHLNRFKLLGKWEASLESYVTIIMQSACQVFLSTKTTSYDF
jgi:hypothetical protein